MVGAVPLSARACQNLQPVLGGCRAPKFVRVQELFPASPACLVQQRGRGESYDKVPGAPTNPVIKRFQRRRIIFVQRLLVLIGQRGALLNERDLVTAEQLQFGDDRVLRRQRPPRVSVQAQRVG